jgi:hypothetical protein
MIRVVHPESQIPDPDPELYPTRIPDPGVKWHRIPDPDPQHCQNRIIMFCLAMIFSGEVHCYTVDAAIQLSA